MLLFTFPPSEAIRCIDVFKVEVSHPGFIQKLILHSSDSIIWNPEAVEAAITESAVLDVPCDKDFVFENSETTTPVIFAIPEIALLAILLIAVTNDAVTLPAFAIL
tara:strand:- start:207 stop:524 length:318 start_codon:yes stop_codon:yes gene_type:complete